MKGQGVPGAKSNHRLFGDDSRTLVDSYSSDIAFFDFEMTRLAPGYHEVIDLAVVQVRQSDFHVVSEWHSRVAPSYPERMSASAKTVTNYRPEDWAKATSPAEAFATFFALTRNLIVAGHKIDMDLAFAYLGCKQHKILQPADASPWYMVIDTMSLSHQLLRGIIPRIRSELILRALGIPPEPLPHTALNGTHRARRIYERLTRMTCTCQPSFKAYLQSQ